MGKSKKKYPYCWEGGSAKQKKQIHNRMFRRVSKQRIEQEKDPFFVKQNVRLNAGKWGGLHSPWATPSDFRK